MAGDKGLALLNFLRATVTLRRKRISSYGPEDKVLWLAEVPKERAECRSPFLSDKPDDFGDVWLEVHKKRIPERPPVPDVVKDWVRADELDNPEMEPELLPEIRVIVKRQVPDPEAPAGTQRTIVEEMSELRRLMDQPGVEEAWLEYLIYRWEPWAQEMREWKKVQTVYESLDFIRRRLEEAEERYELVLAIGFLQWRDPSGAAVARHVLTAPVELIFDAARGVLTVTPAASFAGFRIELDMLDPQYQPRLNKAKLDELLAELDIQAWDISRVGPILHEIANSLSADSVVYETFDPADRVEERPRLSWAPAIVFRERQSTAYEILIDRFIHKASTEGGLEGTAPWVRFIREGEPPSTAIGSTYGDHAVGLGEFDRYLFPLPANEEQRQIVQRLESDPCVLVKGPPGTGKSHTIANLICHLLARGERVLVTAHAPKALTVLRELLPDDIRSLCVTALSSSREDQRLLEESVRGILRRKNEWRGPDHVAQEIQKAESHLRELEGELARAERDLHTFREAQTHTHNLPGGYSGTAAQIARQVNEEEQEFGWFPEVAAEVAFPLDPLETEFLRDAHVCFTGDARAELELEIGDRELPGPDEFEALVTRLTTAEAEAKRTSRGVDEAKVESLEPAGTEELRGLRRAVQALSELALRSRRVLGEISDDVVVDLLAGADTRWSRHAADSEALLADARRLLEAIGSVKVELPEGIAEDRLRTDVERRLAHFEAGGRKGFWIVAPRVVRDTRYIVAACRVNGKNVAEVGHLRCVRDYLILQDKIRQLREVWGTLLAEAPSLRQAVSRAGELTAALKELLAFFKSEQGHLLATVLETNRADLASASGRGDWLKAIDALLASREAREAQQELDSLVQTVRGLAHGLEAHPCMRSLEDGARARDVTGWRTAWQERERLRKGKERLARYEAALEKLDRSCPGLADLLRNTSGDATWRGRVRKLREAWAWAAARAWLRQVSNTSAYEARVQDYHRLKQQIERATERLASLKAWKAFFDGLDEKTVQSLHAWTRAVDRIGKGTGKHAYRHRRTAQKYLLDCVPSIPAWIMPLHKLWDSVDAVPGLFDTVIVDEASQAGVEALALLLLAKRIVVVGDEKQNSPEAVGVLEDDIVRLAREHLKEFRFRDEFRPDTSLFDHAERAFGKRIALREHFRCVPEIIRFSNDLCYRDSPLIPLRQPPPKRIKPLCSSFVKEGKCEGEGPRIRNRAEAEVIVEQIVKLVDDEAYEGKTMGVIALQGHAQARLIETLLAQRLDPKVIQERRLRCGEPATFQGDQRDVIFLSLVIAPNVYYRALTRLPDERRFNVAMSRARDQAWLFYSVKPHELSPDDLRHRLIMYFESWQNAMMNVYYENCERLERAARRHRQRGNQPEPYESWFEVDVALELLRRGYRVRPQVDVAGYRIDLVIEGFEARLAVECDGDEWHGPEQYERDMRRQRQLERAGWTFVRVRESDFYVDKQRAVNAVVKTCDELGIRPVDFVEEPQRERPRASGVERGSPTAALEETAVASEDREQSAAEAEMSSSTVGPFAGYSEALGFPDPREVSTVRVREILRQIIEQDGPLTRSAIYRLYVEGCPQLQRCGKTVRQMLSRALGEMLRTGEIVQEEELGDGSPEGQVLRMAGAPRVKVRPAGRRDLLEIPPSELIAVLGNLGLSPSVADEKLFRAVLDYYGYKRLTVLRKQYLSKVVRIFKQGT